MLDIVYIAVFDYLAKCAIREQAFRREERQKLPSAADCAAAIALAHRRMREGRKDK